MSASLHMPRKVDEAREGQSETVRAFPSSSGTRPEVKTSLNVLVTVHVTFDRKHLTTQI